MVSNLVIAPFILVWKNPTSYDTDHKQLAERALLICVVIFTGILVFHGVFGVAINNSPLTYIVFPPLIWAAIRFGQQETVTITFFFSLFAVWSTAIGYGPFTRERLSESLLYLQGFISVISITALILAAVAQERRQLEKRKDDFIGFASHELKTPLTSINLFMEIVQKNVTHERAPKTKIYLKRIDEQVHKLVLLVNDMLDVTKIQAGKLELRKEWFSMTDLITEILMSMKTEDKKHIFLFKGEMHQEVYGDRERIMQVLMNLLSNAVKYSPEKRKISVSSKEIKGKLYVSIRDHGIGIDAMHQKRIFERFYRVTDIYTQTFPGLGIGLYLSQMIIKEHDGEFFVKSILGKGSTFSFSLPIIKK